MELRNAEKLANDLMREHMEQAIYVHGWHFAWDNAKSRGGAAHYATKKITLSRLLVPMWSEDEVRETLLHEIGHVLAGHQAGHNWEWKRIVASIGGNPTRTHDNETVAARWNGICSPACGNTFTQHRETPTMYRKMCRTCRTKITWFDGPIPTDATTTATATRPEAPKANKPAAPATPVTTVTVPTHIHAPYYATCPCGHDFTRSRMTANAQREICGTCRAPLTYVHARTGQPVSATEVPKAAWTGVCGCSTDWTRERLTFSAEKGVCRKCRSRITWTDRLGYVSRCDSHDGIHLHAHGQCTQARQHAIA